MSTRSTKIVVTPGAASGHGLPPVGFAFDTAGTALWGRAFPDDRTYAYLCGPPGGVLFVSVKPMGGRADDPGGEGGAGAAVEALREFVEREYGGPGATLSFGPPGALEVAGEERPAVVFYYGQKHPLTSTAACAVCVVRIGGADLVIVVGVGGNPQVAPDCLAVASYPPLAQVLETFELGEFEPEPDETAAARSVGGMEVTPAADGEVEGLEPEVEREQERDAEGEPQRLAPDPHTGLTADRAAALVREIREAMRRSGLWRDEPPGAAEYGAMSGAKQLAWSLQASLPSVEMSLLHAEGTEGEGPVVEGILQMLAPWSDMFRAYPEAEEVVQVLARGLTG